MLTIQSLGENKVFRILLGPEKQQRHVSHSAWKYIHLSIVSSFYISVSCYFVLLLYFILKVNIESFNQGHIFDS